MPRIKRNGTGREVISDYERGDFPETEYSEDVAAPEDAETILANARALAEEKVREAYAEGFRRGQEAGEAQFRESVAEAAGMLRSASDAITRAREEFLSSLEPQVVDIVRMVLERVLEREIRTDDDLIRTTAHSALARLADYEHVTLRVNPIDLAAAREYRASLLDEFDGIEQLDIVSDDAIEPGGCIAETDTVHVDAQVQAQLSEIITRMLA